MYLSRCHDTVPRRSMWKTHIHFPKCLHVHHEKIPTHSAHTLPWWSSKHENRNTERWATHTSQSRSSHGVPQINVKGHTGVHFEKCFHLQSEKNDPHSTHTLPWRSSKHESRNVERSSTNASHHRVLYHDSVPRRWKWWEDLVVYYETIKREPYRRHISECQCDERLKAFCLYY